MKSHRRLLRVAALLNVLLVVTAQCFGIGRAFLCECSGAAVMTAADHCHDAVPCSDHENECGGAPREDHAAVSEELRGITAGAVAAPEMVPVLVAVLQPCERSALQSRAVELRGARLDASRPPPGIVVARAVELLI